jgi:hypothetical protein
MFIRGDIDSTNVQVTEVARFFYIKIKTTDLAICAFVTFKLQDYRCLRPFSNPLPVRSHPYGQESK